MRVVARCVVRRDGAGDAQVVRVRIRVRVRARVRARVRVRVSVDLGMRK